MESVFSLIRYGVFIGFVFQTPFTLIPVLTCVTFRTNPYVLITVPIVHTLICGWLFLQFAVERAEKAKKNTTSKNTETTSRFDDEAYINTFIIGCTTLLSGPIITSLLAIYLNLKYVK